MQYSVRYYRGSGDVDTINAGNEVYILCNADNIKRVDEFLEKYPNKKIVIEFTDEIDELLNDFASLSNQWENLVFCFSREKYTEKIKAFPQIKFFFTKIVETYGQLRDFIDCGVSEMRIGGEIGFDIGFVSQICKNNSIEIRVDPLKITNQKSSNLLKEFFIRPDDIFLYETYIDTLEFSTVPYLAQIAFFDIYNRGKFGGNLLHLFDEDFILEKSDLDIDSSLMPPVFGISRLRCRHMCNNCRTCDDVKNAAEKIKEIGMYIEKN